MNEQMNEWKWNGNQKVALTLHFSSVICPKFNILWVTVERKNYLSL